MKKVIAWILVILWMGVIFFLSSMNGEESMSASTGEIKKVVSTTYKVIGLDESNVDDVSTWLNVPIRKCMHITEYFILTLLLCNAFYVSGIKDKRLIIYSIIICVLYALSDEYHQSFNERTSSIIDVLIDSIGCTIASIIIYLKNFKGKSHDQRKKLKY